MARGVATKRGRRGNLKEGEVNLLDACYNHQLCQPRSTPELGTSPSSSEGGAGETENATQLEQLVSRLAALGCYAPLRLVVTYGYDRCSFELDRLEAELRKPMCSVKAPGGALVWRLKQPDPRSYAPVTGKDAPSRGAAYSDWLPVVVKRDEGAKLGSKGHSGVRRDPAAGGSRPGGPAAGEHGVAGAGGAGGGGGDSAEPRAQATVAPGRRAQTTR